VEAWLNSLWYGRGRGGWLLLPISALYRLTMATRRVLYRVGILPSVKVEKPVIVVGNLTVGGTGKTPFVIWLAARLRDAGHRPGIVSRGYGRRDDAPRLVEDSSSPTDVGDEPLLLRRRTGCPVAVGRDRPLAARLVLSQNVDVVLSDDGLQHLALRRECEIVLIDGSRGFGNGRLLPAGPLRESASRLRRVDAIVMSAGLTESTLAGRPVFHMALDGDLAEPLLRHRPVAHARQQGGAPLAQLARQHVHAVAGIGNPERFFALLERRGLHIERHAFPDHHPFTAADLAFGDDLPILMTEKDAVKCAAFATARMFAVPIEASFTEAQAAALLALIAGRM
jgi:tetraacyldisaccharide 4'-kinase